MTEAEIISAVIKGDTEKYRILVEQYSKMCFSVAYRITQDVVNSEDIVQDAFISAYENLKRFKSESKFSTWLYRIVTNKALAYKNGIKYFDEINNASIEEEIYDVELDIRNSLLLKKALSILSENERFVVELFYLQEQSIKEIAEICKSSLSNVKVILHRARKKMNDHIIKYDKFASNE